MINLARRVIFSLATFVALAVVSFLGIDALPGDGCTALLGITLTPGKIGSQIDSTSHKTVAITNSGSVIAITLNWLTTLLIRFCGNRPSSNPTTIALGNAITAATASPT